MTESSKTVVTLGAKSDTRLWFESLTLARIRVLHRKSVIVGIHGNNSTLRKLDRFKKIECRFYYSCIGVQYRVVTVLWGLELKKQVKR